MLGEPGSLSALYGFGFQLGLETTESWWLGVCNVLEVVVELLHVIVCRIVVVALLV